MAILRYPNEKFYANELDACDSPTTINTLLRSAHIVSPTLPIVFPAISCQNELETSSPSWLNRMEAVQVKV